MPYPLWFSQAPQAIAYVFVTLFIFVISVLAPWLEHTGLLSGLNLLKGRKVF